MAMEGHTVRRHYQLHTWCGIALGLLLFLLCVSGALAVYKDELNRWSEVRVQAQTERCDLDADAVFARFSQMADVKALRRITLPEHEHGHYLFRLQDGSRLAIDRCGRTVSAGNSLLADFFVNLHTRLFMGHEGRWLIGVAGFAMLASLLSGILFYKKILREMFTQRWFRSVRLALSDAHKTLAVWGLPFYLVIALTGVWLGLYGLIIPAYEFVQHQRGVAVAEQTHAPSAANGGATTLNALLARAQATVPGLQPVFIDLHRPKKQPVVVQVRGDLPGELVQRHRAGADFDFANGALLATLDPREYDAAGRLHDMMMPLHFGDWGGSLLKAIYALLGLAAAALMLSGLSLWAERRTRHAGLFGAPAGWPARMVAGLGGGGALAMLALPLAALLHVQWPPLAGVEREPADALFTCFLVVWGLGAAALAVTSPRTALRLGLGVAALICAATVIAGVAFNGVFTGVEAGYAGGAALIALAWRRRRGSPHAASLQESNA